MNIELLPYNQYNYYVFNVFSGSYQYKQVSNIKNENFILFFLPPENFAKMSIAWKSSYTM